MVDFKAGLNASPWFFEIEMGRLAELCATIAAEAEEGPSGMDLTAVSWNRLRNEEWSDSDIGDALGIVRDCLLQSELFDAADSLSARLVDILSEFAGRQAFDRLTVHGATIPIEVVAQLVRRVTHLDEILDAYREGSTVDRRRFDELRGRLENVGIEDTMNPGISRDEDE
ncbi:MAG: hypothetical protein JXO72_06080 [Vicinamibacteria bacterium]|nr:hypothetical protein [Vicinamibacteria bacterium]